MQTLHYSNASFPLKIIKEDVIGVYNRSFVKLPNSKLIGLENETKPHKTVLVGVLDNDGLLFTFAHWIAYCWWLLFSTQITIILPRYDVVTKYAVVMFSADSWCRAQTR